MAWFQGLPVAIVLAYFFLSWTESFPMTAYYTFMIKDIPFTPPMMSKFYAITWFPWMWKPLYGVLSDFLPICGCHRKPYIIIGAIMSCIGYLCTSYFVESVSGFYVATMIRATGNAMFNLMLGGFLVDEARKDVKNASGLQSVANAAKWAGTLVSKIAGLYIYANATPLVSTRAAIGLTSLAPAVVALLALFLKEEKRTKAAVLDLDALRFGATILLVQVNLIITQLQHWLPGSWWKWLIVSSVISVLLICAMWNSRLKSQKASSAESLTGQTQTGAGIITPLQWSMLGLFCILVNMLPSSGIVLGTFQYMVLDAEAYQKVQIIGSAAALLASLAFGFSCNRRSLAWMFVLSVAVATILAFSPLVFVTAALAEDAIKNPATLGSTLGVIAIIGTVVGRFGGMYSLLPVDTLVTAASSSVGSDRSSTTYAVLLALYGFGATVAGLVSAPIESALDLNGDNWSNLRLWICLTAVLQLFAIPMLLLVPRSLFFFDAATTDDEATGAQA